ncbi:MAG: MBL fold metallo-hydrolase [Lachnospiraceae bacterium]|jgi:ribonuclease Z|nr:MBL fold metallo-hydrolase [Lachnospiraceae bacterium]
MDKELLYVFGTGNAAATRLYNTCFALRCGDEFFMVDTGGGNGILGILEYMEVPVSRIHHLFVTHEHTDHILGVVWMVRMIATAMKKGEYEGEAHIYCHEGLVETIRTLCRLTIQDKFYCMLGEQIRLEPLKDGDMRHILDYDVTFFDIHSTKARQFGFTLTLNNGKKLTCTGDEPYNPLCESYVKGSDWLLHEAFCLYAEREQWKPYEKHHATVKEACELAETMQIPNLLLWHTEDSNIAGRQRLYQSEGQKYYSGSLFVPDDKSLIIL